VFTEFDTPELRDNAIIAIVKQYQSNPQVQETILHYRKDIVPVKESDDLAACYLKEVSQFPPLSKQDEYTYFSAIETGLATYKKLSKLDKLDPSQEEMFVRAAAAYEILYVTNLQMVATIAQKYPQTLPLLNLVYKGNATLSSIISHFDTTKAKDHKFSTYAPWWIRQQIDHAIADGGLVTRLDVGRYEQWLGMRRQIKLLEQELGHQPTLTEIGRTTGITLGKVQELGLQEHIPWPLLTND